MRKIILCVLAISSITISAQQNMVFQTACHPADVKHYDTQTLRDRFVMEKVMAADEINLTYSMYDRFIYGGAMPVTKDLKLETHPQLRADYFMRNRELGIINTGGDGVVIVDGQEYPLGYSEALYVGRGWLGKDKNGNDTSATRSAYSIRVISSNGDVYSSGQEWDTTDNSSDDNSNDDSNSSNGD